MEKHIFLGLLIPVIFFGFTGLVKSLIKKELLWSNFYLGTDIALAALANGIVNMVDGAHQVEHALPGSVMAAQFGNSMFYTAVCILAAVGALFGVMALHQRFDVLLEGEEGNSPWVRGIWLGVVSNLLGASVLTMFIYMKLRRLI
ncbi:MAG TPA: hypothetical protein VGU67_14455 [Edaphobacter sp.]|nr:hypothetical protein [Edaphobacter sp.]